MEGKISMSGSIKTLLAASYLVCLPCLPIARLTSQCRFLANTNEAHLIIDRCNA